MEISQSTPVSMVDALRTRQQLAAQQSELLKDYILQTAGNHRNAHQGILGDQFVHQSPAVQISNVVSVSEDSVLLNEQMGITDIVTCTDSDAEGDDHITFAQH